MLIAFYIAGAIAVLATILALTRSNAVHALLYLVVSLLAVAVIFYLLGAPFVAALEILIYAGAIMVLFVFVVMMLNLGERATVMERGWLTPGMWVGPAILAAILIVELGYLLLARGNAGAAGQMVETPAAVPELGPKGVGMSLFGPYVIGVELASMLLLAGLVGAYHVGRRHGGSPGLKPGTYDASAAATGPRSGTYDSPPSGDHR